MLKTGKWQLPAFNHKFDRTFLYSVERKTRLFRRNLNGSHWGNTKLFLKPGKPLFLSDSDIPCIQHNLHISLKIADVMDDMGRLVFKILFLHGPPIGIKIYLNMWKWQHIHDSNNCNSSIVIIQTVYDHWQLASQLLSCIPIPPPPQPLL